MYLSPLRGEGNGNPLHYSCLGNPMDRGAWWATVHGLAKELVMIQQLNKGITFEKIFLFSNLRMVQFSSVSQSCPTLCNPMNHSTPDLPVNHQLPEFTQTHVYWVGMPSNHPILCRPLLLLPSIFPSIRIFSNSQLFAWGAQSIGVSASTSILPMNTQDQSSLEWTGLISLKFKGLSRVFSNTTVQKHQFFGTQLSSQSNSHIHTWPLEKT